MNTSVLPAAANSVSWSLIVAVCCFFILSIAISSKYLTLRLAFIVCVIKYAIVFTYFAWWSDGTWHIGGDDSGYFDTGRRLLEGGENPVSIWFTTQGKYFLIESPTAAIYNWWNMFWMYCFGEYYFAPVLANVFITFLSAYIFDRILRFFEFGVAYRTGYSIYFLLHYKVIAWSSFLNIKESIIVFILLLCLYSLLEVMRGNFRYSFALTLSIVSFFGIRFYFPALIGAAFIAYVLITSKRKVIAIGASACLLSILLWRYWHTLGLVERLIDTRPPSILKHFVKQFLSPLPWQITRPATYLIVPSIAQSLLLPGALVSCWSLLANRKTKEMLLIVLTIAVGYTFYTFMVGISSARHTSVFGTLFLLFEYHFIFMCIKYGLEQQYRSNRPLMAQKY